MDGALPPSPSPSPSPAPSPPSVPVRPPRPVPPPRRRPWAVVGIVLLVLVALAGAAVGAQQRYIAATWQGRAVAFETARDEAIGRTEALQRQLDEVVASLDVSEGDVERLEQRLRELADEKAQAEDVATTTGVERDTLVALSTSIAGAVTALDACVDDLFDLLNDAIDAFNRQGAGEQVDVGPLNTARTATTASCNTARNDAARAAAQAEQILR